MGRLCLSFGVSGIAVKRNWITCVSAVASLEVAVAE
jgi:hypothetical protein